MRVNARIWRRDWQRLTSRARYEPRLDARSWSSDRHLGAECEWDG